MALELGSQSQHVRADKLYALWCAARQLGETATVADLSRINILYHDNGMVALFPGDVEVPLPGPAPLEWQERVDAARSRAGLSQSRTKRDSIKCRGITIPKRWNWTKHREWEERDNVARLTRGSGNPKPTRFAEETNGTKWRTP